MSYRYFASLLLLCFTKTLSAQTEPHRSVYQPTQQLLKLAVVRAFERFWTVELKEFSPSQFQLQSFIPFSGTPPDVYPEFNAASGILTIPDLQVEDTGWNVTLKDHGHWQFKIVSYHGAETRIAADQRYIIHNDGTVTDRVTGLQWMRCSLGQTWTGQHCIGNPLRLRMPEAAYEAFNSRFAGKNDWRLPSIDELKTLIYCSTGVPNRWNLSGRACEGDFQRPTLYLEAFPDAPPAVYWSNTPLKADPGEDYTLTVSFNYGHVYYSYFNDAYEAARFVRGDAKLAEGAEVVGGFKE